MKNQGQVDPVFGLAIQRGDEAGALSLGGVPEVNYKGEFAQTPIRIVDIAAVDRMNSERSFYTIYPDGFKYNRHAYDAKDEKVPFIVDTGTSVTFLPTKIAKDLFSMYEPQAQFIQDLGKYYVDCSATAPSFAVTIDRHDFYMDPADMIVPHLKDPQTGLCKTGVEDGANGPYVLGVTFLQNVVAVFDVDKAQMKFAEHHY